MRQGLLPGLLSALKFNTSRNQSRIKLFELGTIFNKSDSKVIEQTAIAGIYSGNTLPLNWKSNSEVSFFEVKGDIEQLLAKKGDLSFQALTDCKYLHPGQSASIILNGITIGMLGVLHPAIAKAVQLKGKLPVLFEINYEKMKRNIPQEVKAISKFPSISRDIAVIVDESVKSDEIIHIAKQSVNDLYHEIKVFDVYSGENLPKNKKSIALNLILQSSSKTLIDEDIINITNLIVSNLSNDIGAVLRE
jgi:phenylalanyl-tRNA synthetase beta chain